MKTSTAWILGFIAGLSIGIAMGMILIYMTYFRYLPFLEGVVFPGGGTQGMHYYEKISIKNVTTVAVENGWNINITILNEGSLSTKIDDMYINGISYDKWGATISGNPDPDLPFDMDIGAEQKIIVSIPKNAKYDDTQLSSGMVVDIKFHSTGGKEYFTSTVLP